MEKKMIVCASLALLAAPMALYAQSSMLEEEIAAEEVMIENQSAPLNPLLDGEWTIYNLRGERVTGEQRPQITISVKENRFYGNNGCNILNGDVVGEGSNGLQFTGVLSTQRLCHDAPFEYLINTTLDDVRYYSIKQYGHEYYLDLENARHQVIMVLRQHNMNFLDGAWRVVRIDGEPNRNEGVEMVLDIPERHLHGNTGCNIVNGNIFIDPDKPNSIQFSQLATTRMMCPDIATETSFLVALEEVESAFAEGNNTVRMLDKKGHEVLVLQKISAQELRNEQ